MRCFCRKIRAFHVKVVLLDEQELIQEVQDNSPGQEILDTVFRHLNLIETAYFGLRYLDASNQTHWLDPSKKIAKQLKGTDPLTLYFGVKFYAADPCKLLEEITRYQFFLQVKQDILKGRLPVSFDLAAELGSYVVQSEMGDYDPRRHSPGYVSEFRFLSNQTVELESRIAELHKGLVGQLPAVAELSYLDKVKWLEMYGVDLHPVLGEDNVEYFLGLTPSGIIVLRNKTKVGNYYWPRISKIYFKGRYFMLRVCDKNNDENTYGFETPSKPACKHLWRCCVEHHAFFRLLQVSPAGQDIFALGSRFRYSGRTEKQAQRDAQIRLRSPPQFTRTPSRRYQRRIVEGAQDAPKVEETVNNENIPPLEMKSVSIPQPAHSVGSLYRSTCSIPAALPSHGRPDSPRSTRSAPWTQPHARGLYAGASPRSVRSAGHNPQLPGRLARRSSSVESQSSNDSRSCKKHRHHRSRRGSDNDSELSKCSGKSHSHRRHRHRSHGTKRDSGSEQDQHHRHRHKSYSRHRHSGSHYELVDSEAQWKEVQRKQAEGGTGIQQATVVTNHRSGYMNSGMETESEQSYHHKRKHKKHRSRSRSPSDAKARLPDELKKHLEFGLIETEGMSESQLREIPYKVVETPGKGPRVKLSPSSKHRQRSPRRAKSCSAQDERCVPPSSGDSPPPPYSPPQAQGHPPGAPRPSSADDLDRIAETKPPPDAVNSSASQSPAGSLRNRVGRDDNNINLCGGASGNLPRISTALGIPDYSSVNKGAHHHAATRAFSSALYDNPGFLLSKMNGHSSLGSGKPHPHHPHHHHSSANSNNNYHPASNINHEHSDSGLSAGSQDYSSYVADHPSDVPKYAQTTKLCTTSSQASFVSTGGLTNNSPLHNHQGHGQSRAYPFSSLRHHHHQPPAPLALVNRHWHWERERDASSGTYRTLPGTGACNTNNNWSGSGRRGGGPLYFQHHSSGSAGGAVMGSGWGKDPETIREDDESLEHTGSDSSPCKSTAAALTQTNGREVTHEMSTEL